MATHHLFSICIALTIISIVSAAGITIDLIDRNSPDSPFYSNSTSDVDKLYDSFHRSILRARELARRATRPARPTFPFSPLVHSGSSNYLVDVGLGTPELRFTAILETGSDLTWTQCAPCEQCFKQILPVFDPSQSRSYSLLRCDSNECNLLPPSSRGCNSANNTCTYTMDYGDGSTSAGELAHETLTLGYGPGHPRVRLIDFPLGCGHRNQGLFSPPVMGLFGLGQGPLSFPSLTSSLYGGKFAYCLIPKSEGFNVKSKLSIGDDAVVSGRNAATSPMASGPLPTYYFLTLKGVSVAEKKTQIPQSTSAKPNGLGPRKNVEEAGNMLIDSGVTLTFLPVDMFNKLLLELKLQIKAKTITDSNGKLQLCYQGEIKAPYITFHFIGADLGLPTQNTFITIAKDVTCLAMLPSDASIFGNIAQANFVVAHDLAAKTITFKATDCQNYLP